MANPPRTPAERFATLLFCLAQAVAARSGWDRVASPLIGLITIRLLHIKQHFARFADSVRDGRPFARRRTVTPRERTARGPRPPSKLPRTAGWLWALMPEAVHFRSQLEFLLLDPETIALLAAAPVTTVRAVRSLCWMLRLPPPPSLARPRASRRPPTPPPPAEPAAPPPPAPAAAPLAPQQRKRRPVPLLGHPATAPPPRPARARSPPRSA